MFTKYIDFENFDRKKGTNLIKKRLEKLFKEDNCIIRSLGSNYENNFSRKLIAKLKRFKDIIIIGMGGSILGSKAIYNFLNKKTKKKFTFIDNLLNDQFYLKNKKKLNLIISKSGNTLETISNVNLIIKRSDKNLFITGRKESNLINLAKKLKSEVIHHNDFIGGRYSVLSEVGMLPAELMGFKYNKFKRLNNLIKNKNFLESLVINVSNTINLVNRKRYNSIILNYDEKSLDLFNWYQQLIAESLGKKGKGILPVVSLLPRDNHSLMQLYLDGIKNNFYTFFFVKDEINQKKYNFELFSSSYKLKGKSLNHILEAQYHATKKTFKNKKIPFRSFFIKKRNEETLGELFTFFILETILLGKAMNVDPYNQPSVELIKKETKIYLA